MKTMYKNLKYVFFALVICFVTVSSTVARVRTIQTEREFDAQIKKSHLMVACFYESGTRREGKNNQEKMRPFFRMYEAVSSKKLYDDADIVFTKINIKNQEVSGLMNRYGVSMSPSFIIFMNGEPVKAPNGNVAQLIGFVSEHELQEFINTYCMNDIQKIVSAKEQNRRDRGTRSQDPADPYFYPAVYFEREYDFSWQKPLKYDSEGNEIQ